MNKCLLAAFGLIFVSVNTWAQNTFNCLSHSVYEKQMASDPVFRNNQAQLERETEVFINQQGAHRPAAATYIIPVVFHVIYTTAQGNISDAQIVDQINILNKEFNRQQADTALTPAQFKPVASPFSVEFRLATIDPNGNCTNGINRIYNTLTNCSVKENDVKAVSYWPSNKYLNIWLTQSMHYAGSTDCFGGGYATFPGGPANIDGINIRGDLIGSIGTAATNTSWGNFLGRYLIHELGHWFNLRHIWGDAICGTDLVNDTPPAVYSNSFCPGFPHNAFNSCGSTATGEMFMNYMDYTNGPCLNMFTAGQVARMTAAITSAVSGRNNLWSASNLNATGTDNPYTYPVACPSVPDALPTKPIIACVGDSVKFSDNSYGGLSTSRLWDFGGEPSSSLTDSVVKVKYSLPGVYSFKLTKNYLSSSKTTTFTNSVYIINNKPNINYFVPFEDSFEDPNSFYSEWTIVDNDNDMVTWDLNSNTAYTGSSCISLANYNNKAPTVDEIVSPSYDLRAVENPTLTFRLNFTRISSVNKDQLQVYISNNCGRTWTSIYQKSANGSLRTMLTDQASSYTPAISSAEWRLEKVNILPFLAGGIVNFKFSFTGGGGNNIFIDDVNVDGNNTTGIGSIAASSSQISIYPNPAKNSITIQYSPEEKAELCVDVLDVLGKRCLSVKNTANDGRNAIVINLQTLEAGVYFVNVRRQGALIHAAKMIKEGSE